MNAPVPSASALLRAGSRNEHTHRRNLSVLLTLAHQRGPLSRADLTRATGLNRSTVGALVAELTDLDLVNEAPSPGNRTVGRPSPIVTANPGVVAFGVNPDIDAVVVSLVGLGGVVHGRKRIETDGELSVDHALDIMGDGMSQLLSDFGAPSRTAGIGVAVPGLVRAHGGIVTRAPHLTWADVPLQSLIVERTGLPTLVGNDAGLAMLAESVFGAGRDLTDVVYLNGSASGIGGGALVGGVPLRGTDGYAGELGHTLVTSDGIACHCGRRGCLETEVNLQRILAAAGLDEHHAGEFLEHLPASDSAALSAELDRAADVLGHGIANLISVFNPQAVVLGGFLSALYEERATRIHETTRADAFSPLADQLRIEQAKLGENVALVGAAELAFTPLLHDPLM